MVKPNLYNQTAAKIRTVCKVGISQWWVMRRDFVEHESLSHERFFISFFVFKEVTAC